MKIILNFLFRQMSCRAGKCVFFFGSFLILISPVTRADEDVYRYPLGTQTMAAFLAVSERLAEHPVTKGTFEQEKILSRLGRSLKSEGNFIIAAARGMVWETLKPFPSTLVLGKEYMIQSRPGGQKTVISAEGNETFLRLAEVLSAVFTGNARGLLDNFEIFFRVMDSGRTWELGLSPLDRAIGSFAARITMSGDEVIRFIMINELNGDITRYTMANHNHPAELSANEKALFTIP